MEKEDIHRGYKYRGGVVVKPCLPANQTLYMFMGRFHLTAHEDADPRYGFEVASWLAEGYRKPEWALEAGIEETMAEIDRLVAHNLSDHSKNSET